MCTSFCALPNGNYLLGRRLIRKRVDASQFGRVGRRKGDRHRDPGGHPRGPASGAGTPRPHRPLRRRAVLGQPDPRPTSPTTSSTGTRWTIRGRPDDPLLPAPRRRLRDRPPQTGDIRLEARRHDDAAEPRRARTTPRATTRSAASTTPAILPDGTVSVFDNGVELAAAKGGALPDQPRRGPRDARPGLRRRLGPVLGLLRLGAPLAARTTGWSPGEAVAWSPPMTRDGRRLFTLKPEKFPYRATPATSRQLSIGRLRRAMDAMYRP